MIIKEHLQKVSIFVINLLIVGLIVCGIKEKDKNNISLQNESREDLSPVATDVLELQNKIATDRENKLRDLNTTPKQIEQQDTTTTKTTVTPEPVAAPKPDKKTKSS
jgi:hypothetical protein